jgi:HSCB C-terminal oligomerisation domain
VEYLIRLEEGRARKEGAGGDGGTLPGVPSNKDKPKAPPELLAEMFEIQEALEEAKTEPLDDAARAALTEQRTGLEARMADAEARITGPLSAAWDAAAPAEKAAALNALKEALATRAYLRTVIEDIANALDAREQEARQ